MTPVDPCARLKAAMAIAGRLVDALNGVDLHETAYEVYRKRTGSDDGGNVSDEDYAEAFVRAALFGSAP